MCYQILLLTWFIFSNITADPSTAKGEWSLKSNYHILVHVLNLIMYSNVRQRRHWALLQVRNCLGVAAVSITGEVIGGLGSCIFVPVFLQLPNFLSTDLAAARKYFRVTSMWACIDLHPKSYICILTR